MVNILQEYQKKKKNLTKKEEEEEEESRILVSMMTSLPPLPMLFLFRISLKSGKSKREKFSMHVLKYK